LGTVNDLKKYLGLPGLLRSGALDVPIIINDVSESFGRINVLVAPVGGAGSQWVMLDRIKFETWTKKT
tara:strand:+ start:250 stop:453 length:204 start_codon:yes stop_codon:yes gene_type:complete